VHSDLKGATNAAPNVAIRAVTNEVPAGAAVPKLVPITLGPKMYFECDSVTLEGFEIAANGMDGSGVKFNERCSFRNCHLIRSPVMFQYCKKIEFEGNLLTNSPTYGVYLYGTSHARVAGNTIEQTGPSQAGITSYGASDCEITGNTVRRNYYGMNFTAAGEIVFTDNRYEQNQYGLFLNSCRRMTGQRLTFDGNVAYHLYATFASAVEPYRFYDCSFQNTPTNDPYASIIVEGACTVDIVNAPLQSFSKAANRGPLWFSVYVDVLVTNEQGTPLGRVPLRVLEGNQPVATSRTESVGPRTGYTPLPSTRRPLIVPWCRVVPAQGVTNPVASTTYQLEADGTALGYGKQVVPLTVDESFVRPDPEKPTKTIAVKLPKAK
jgi:parallel beta-helix repeat protein